MIKMSFEGIIPPLVTIFDQDGEIDWEGNIQLIDHVISKGVHGLLVMGSTGEFSHLSLAEKKEYLKRITAHVQNRVPIIVGTSSTHLRETIELTHYAAEEQADAVMIVNPYYWKLPEDKLFAYYGQIAEAVPISIFLYNFPQLTGQEMSVQLAQRLATTYENIIGIKETIGSISHIRCMIQQIKKERPDFRVFSAFDDHLLPALIMGADGSMNGSANFLPQVSVSIYEQYRAGQIEQSVDDFQLLLEMADLYTMDQPFINVIKEGVRSVLPALSAATRLPQDQLPESKQKILSQLIKTIQDQYR